MIRTQIQLYPEQIRWIKKHGLNNGISMSQAIRDCVDFYRYHVESFPRDQHKKQKTLKIIGSFSTDNGDYVVSKPKE